MSTNAFTSKLNPSLLMSFKHPLLTHWSSEAGFCSFVSNSPLQMKLFVWLDVVTSAQSSSPKFLDLHKPNVLKFCILHCKAVLLVPESIKLC